MYSRISFQGNVGQEEAETQADSLFSTHSVVEIKRVEQKMRLEIEQKKEDLRQMVGERYRDLIEAADSVISMKEESLHVTQLLCNVQNSCQQLQQTHFLKGTGGHQAPPTLSSTHLLALQVKLLMELQEKMRQYLDSSQLLSATLSYLLLRHTATHLTTMDSSSSSSTSPIHMVSGLWKRASGFKTAVVDSARLYLKSPQLERKSAQDALCSLVLLDGVSLSQVFVEYLTARKDAITTMFGPLQQATVKAAVQNLIAAVYQTLQLTADLFSFSSTSTGCTQLLSVIQSLTKSSNAPCKYLIPQSLLNRLPEHILNYAVHLSGNIEDVPTPELNSHCQQWVESCCSEVHPRLSAVLTHVGSLKALASVRDAAYSLLSEDSQQDTLQSARARWATICEASLGQSLSIYDTFIHPLLVEQAKLVISELVAVSEDQLIADLKELLTKHSSHRDKFAADEDIMSFLWQEESNGERGRPSMKTVVENLQLKAECCTPHVYKFCQLFDSKLERLIADLHQFTRVEFDSTAAISTQSAHISSNISRTKPQTSTDEFPFDRFADTQVLHQHTCSKLADTISRFLEEVDNAVSLAVKELESSCPQAGLHMNRVVLLARLCQNLSKFCPSLRQLVEAEQSKPSLKHSYHTAAPSTFGKTKAVSTTSKLELLLDQKGAELLRIWSVHCSQQFTNQLRDYLNSSLDLVHLSSSEVWEEIEIFEEAEGGRKVSTIILIPCQASVYIQVLLYALCREISHIGGHNIDRALLRQLSQDIFSSVVGCYSDLLRCSSPTPLCVPQDCALQLLFDVRFLSLIFSHTTDDEEDTTQRLAKIIDTLHGFIDPFDLDVFSPLLTARLQRQVQRSSVMLGMLTSLRDTPSLLQRGPSGSTPTGSSQEKHIILPLAPVVPRIPLLPTSAPNPARLPSNSRAQTKKVNCTQMTSGPMFDGLQYLYV